MINFFKSQTGLSLIQVMVAGSIILGSAAVITKSLSSQEQMIKRVMNLTHNNQQISVMVETLTNWRTCKATLSRPNVLTGAPLEGIFNETGATIISTGNSTAGGRIDEMVLQDFTPGTGVRLTNANIRVTIKYTDNRGSMGAVGGTQKYFHIPIFLITDGPDIVTCMADDADSVTEALRTACNQFEGNFNIASGVCENLHGPSGAFLNYIDSYFCSNTPGCQHPYSNQSCAGVDIRGLNHGNWVLSGFNSNGAMTCTCMPIPCPDPAAYCAGTDLGTNWCQLNCPQGTASPNDYSPLPSEVCSGMNFTQHNSCGQARSAVGTKGC